MEDLQGGEGEEPGATDTPEAPAAAAEMTDSTSREAPISAATAPDAEQSVALSATAAAEPLALPGTWQLISVGLDLCLRVNPSLRAASMAISGQVLGAVGPLVVLLVVVAGRAPDLLEILAEATPGQATPEAGAVSGAIAMTGLIAAVALVALAVESRIVAVSLLGARAIGRPIAPLEALRRSRQVFWPVAGATAVIQFVIWVIVGAVSAPLGDSEAGGLASTALAAALGVPFVYLVSGIALGGAPALEAIRRSVSMARVRWRLAIVVAVAETLAQILLIIALLAGLDILARISEVLGLGVAGGAPTTFATIALALFATAAAGSLVFLVSALAAAPQVVAFVGLTRYAGGLDSARDDASHVRRVRWLSVPMAIGIVVAVVTAFAGIGSALQAG